MPKNKNTVQEVQGESSGRDGRAVRWAVLTDSDNNQKLPTLYDGSDEENLLLVGNLLGISSKQQSLQLKDILKKFWEAKRREQDEEQKVRRNRKRERELRNLQSSVNYNSSLLVVGIAREVVANT